MCTILTIEDQENVLNSENKYQKTRSLEIFSKNLFKESLVLLIQAAYSSTELNYSQTFI